MYHSFLMFFFGWLVSTHVIRNKYIWHWWKTFEVKGSDQWNKTKKRDHHRNQVSIESIKIKKKFKQPEKKESHTYTIWLFSLVDLVVKKIIVNRFSFGLVGWLALQWIKSNWWLSPFGSCCCYYRIRMVDSTDWIKNAQMNESNNITTTTKI